MSKFLIIFAICSIKLALIFAQPSSVVLSTQEQTISQNSKCEPIQVP